MVSSLGEFIVNFFKDFRKEFKSIKKKEIKRQIPNLLTLSRGLAPIVIIPAILFNKLYFVIILLIIFALTDFLDGKIARKYNLVSEFGVKLDAVCDKIFAISLIIPAIINHGIFIFNFVIFFYNLHTVYVFLQVHHIVHYKNHLFLLKLPKFFYKLQFDDFYL